MASAAMASATTTSSKVNPLSWEVRSATIGDAYPSGQPVDADADAALSINQRDSTSRRAAVGVEANVAFPGTACFAGDRQKLDRQIGWQAPRRRRADPIAVADQIEVEDDRAVADNRLGPRQAQTRGEFGGGRLEAQPAAPRWFVARDQRQSQTEYGEHCEELDQGEAAGTIGASFGPGPRQP